MELIAVLVAMCVIGYFIGDMRVRVLADFRLGILLVPIGWLIILIFRPNQAYLCQYCGGRIDPKYHRFRHYGIVVDLIYNEKS